MKLLIFLIQFVFVLNIQSQPISYQVKYQFSPNVQNLKMIFFKDVSYEITANDKKQILKANFDNGIDEIAGGVKVEINGPIGGFYDITNDIVGLFNSDTTFFRFKPVQFKNSNLDTTIGKYKCYKVQDKKGNYLYLSKDLPYYVNPFFLSQKSIKDGVVLASFANYGIFSISYMKLSDSPLMISYNNKSEISLSDNIFF